MAIFHHSTQVISRKSGQSVCASAAYRSGEKLENERDGLTHDYTRKDGVVHKEILTPKNAPEWATDRERLWNEVEKSEKRVDAQLAREVNIALPTELNREEQIKLVNEYTKENYVDKGMIADVCIHDKEDGNPHAHIMLTMRDIDKDGFGKKNRDWNEHSLATEYRRKWAEKVNHELKQRGHEQRIDHRSNKEQGIEKIPQIHEGAIVREMEKRGIMTDRGDINREIKEQNRQLELITKREPLIQKQKENLLEEINQLATEQTKPYLTTVPEPQKETLSFNHGKVKISELLKDALEYRKSLEQIDTDKAKQLVEWKQRKNDIGQPYRAEAIEKHIQERWGAEWTKIQKEKRFITQKLRDHEQGNGYGMFDRLSGAYKRDGEELHRQSRNIDFREKDLISVFDRTRQELINPQNVNAHGRYEVDKMADRIAQERDPQYKSKREVISRVEEKIIADRQALLSERKLAQSLCHNLEKVRNRNQEIELDLPCNQTGERLSITKAMEKPQIKEQMKQLMGKITQSIKPHQKSLERDRGGMER